MTRISSVADRFTFWFFFFFVLVFCTVLFAVKLFKDMLQLRFVALGRGIFRRPYWVF